MSHSDLVQSRLKVLLSDYGYSFSVDTLIEKAIRGFTSARVLPYKFRGLLDAAEYLAPIVADEQYSRRLSKIGETGLV